MGIDIGPIEVVDGLIFHIDAGNTRSYSGSGITVNGLISGVGITLLNGPTYSSSNGGYLVYDGVNDYAPFNLSGIGAILRFSIEHH